MCPGKHEADPGWGEGEVVPLGCRGAVSPGLAPPEPAPSLRPLESEFEAARVGPSPRVRETQWKHHVGVFSALLAGAGSQHWSGHQGG